MKNGIIRRIIPIILVAVFVLSILASCSGTPKYQSHDTTVVMKIGDNGISADLYRYYYCSYKYRSGEQYSETELRKMTEKSLCEIMAVKDVAKKLKMSLPDDDVKLITDTITSMKKAYKTGEEYYAELSKNYLSEQVFYDIRYNDMLQELLYYYMTDESSMQIDSSKETFEKALESDFLAAVNIVITEKTEDKDTGLSGKELAGSVLEKIKAGEDIYELAEKYSADSESGDRYFAPLTVQDFFEEKVRSLKIGEVSDVYEGDVGYCITKRVALDQNYINKNYDELRENFKFSEYLKIMTEKAESYKVEYTSDFDIFKIDGEKK